MYAFKVLKDVVQTDNYDRCLSRATSAFHPSIENEIRNELEQGRQVEEGFFTSLPNYIMRLFHMLKSSQKK